VIRELRGSAALLWEPVYIVRKIIFDWKYRRGLCY
jgi:hypothetical protein